MAAPGRRRPQRGVEGTPLCPGPGGRLDGEVGSPRDAGVVGEVTEHPPERRDAPSVTSRQRRLGRDQVPDTRDVAGGLARGEVVEDRVHDAGRDIAAQRGCPSGEIGVPVVAQAERQQRLGRLLSRIGDEPDRLHEPV